MTDDQLVTARQCAEEWGISSARARRILASLTPTRRDTTTGAMLYPRTAAQAARDALPGQGARTDLHTTTPEETP